MFWVICECFYLGLWLVVFEGYALFSIRPSRDIFNLFRDLCVMGLQGWKRSEASLRHSWNFIRTCFHTDNLQTHKQLTQLTTLGETLNMLLHRSTNTQVYNGVFQRCSHKHKTKLNKVFLKRDIKHTTNKTRNQSIPKKTTHNGCTALRRNRGTCVQAY